MRPAAGGRKRPICCWVASGASGGGCDEKSRFWRKHMTTNILGERAHIDVRAIERELTALWKQAADDQSEGGQAVTRTCVLNLVVATTGGRAVDEVTATVGQLTARHPNRAIVVGATPGAAEELL